ncbi:hypothetical protein EDD15DRAFT_2409912 [Pisolithus albus]|nr:hypothetical protein EDD15DRAFT_2409912 [Pisolithus albus]
MTPNTATHGSATMTAIAVFENGRHLEGMSYIFDAQIFLEGQNPILAALRYFNRDGEEFPDIGFYFVTARVAMMEPGANICRTDCSPLESEYDLVGDVVLLIPIKIPPGIEHHEVIDVEYRPYIDICGVVHSVDDLKLSFKINAHQYVAALRLPSNASTATSTLELSQEHNKPFKSTFPVECFIPDNNRRWKSKEGKPLLPKSGGYVSVTGFIRNRQRNESGLAGFSIDVESMCFLGRPIISPGTPPKASPVTPGRSSMKFSFSSTSGRKRPRAESNA